MQSTPYSNCEDLKLQDSLYTELKASVSSLCLNENYWERDAWIYNLYGLNVFQGFSVEDTANESRLRDLEDELTWYNEEIRDAVKQIDKSVSRRRIYSIESDKF